MGASYMWHHDEFAGGAFALFDPGQQTRLYEAIVQPEGRIHFAGEHASLAHAWIQGAIESGLRAALAIHLDGVTRPTSWLVARSTGAGAPCRPPPPHAELAAGGGPRCARALRRKTARGP